MWDKIIKALDDREKFEINVASKIDGQRAGLKKYLDIRVTIKNEILVIEDLGEYGFKEHDIDVNPLGIVTIKDKNSDSADLITII